VLLKSIEKEKKIQTAFYSNPYYHTNCVQFILASSSMTYNHLNKKNAIIEDEKIST